MVYSEKLRFFFFFDPLQKRSAARRKVFIAKINLKPMSMYNVQVTGHKKLGFDSFFYGIEAF
jgi:hypothetical protein